jgi:hypothetical protein
LAVEHHVVEPGESLSAIAARYGLAWPELAVANQLDDPDDVVTGRVLHIPPRNGDPDPQPEPQPQPEPVPGEWLGVLHTRADRDRWHTWRGNVPQLLQGEWQAVERAAGVNLQSALWRAPSGVQQVGAGRGGWAEGGAAAQGFQLNRAALAAVVRNDEQAINRMLGHLEQQATQAGNWAVLRSGNATQLPGDSSYRFGFSMCKRLWAWEVIRPYASEQQRQRIDDWYELSIDFLLPAVRASNRQAWGDSYTDGTFKPARNNSSRTEPCYAPNGPAVGWYGIAPHENRSGIQACYIGCAGALLGHELAMAEAAGYFRGWVVACVGKNFITESMRGAGADTWKAWSYASTTVGCAVLAAAALASRGDKSLLDWTTTNDLPSLSNPPSATRGAGRRGIRDAARILADLHYGTVKLYAPGGPTTEARRIRADMPGAKEGTAAVLAALEKWDPPEQVRRLYREAPDGPPQGTWSQWPSVRLMAVHG